MTRLALDWGSSPLARGLRRVPSRFGAGGWIIPARAGFTPEVTRHERHPEDHPRSRGVYVTFRVIHASGEGSSPLARGLLVPGAQVLVDERIIPARAGFTRAASMRSSRLKDHPRSRGVYAVLAGHQQNNRGSSPLARGLHLRGQTERGGGRIIPARAGFTWHSRCSTSPTRDHPRSRGVYTALTAG